MPTNLETKFTISDVNALFKTDFKEYQDVVTNRDSFIWSQIQKPSMTGKATEFPQAFGFAGGASAGRPGDSNPGSYSTVSFSHKKLYTTTLFDRDAVAASMDSKGAFCKAIEEPFEKGVETQAWNENRAFWQLSLTGGLGSIKSAAGVTDNGGGNYSIIISDATWILAMWEEQQLVNIGTGTTDKFEIQSVDPDTKTIVVQRQAGGTVVPANSDAVFLQNSEGNDPHSIPYVVKATSGSLYGITVGRRWRAYQVDMSSAAIDFDVVNDTLLAIEAKVGRKNATTKIVTSYKQFGKLLNQSEGNKRYPVETVTVKAADKRLAEIGFSGLRVLTSRGAIEIVPERFVRDDEMYFLNMNHIKAYTMPKSGWVADDGRNYLRVAGEDSFSAYYARYGQNYIVPTSQGILYNLA